MTLIHSTVQSITFASSAKELAPWATSAQLATFAKVLAARNGSLATASFAAGRVLHYDSADLPVQPPPPPPPPVYVPGQRPFSATSPWNIPTPSTTKWFDTPLLHTFPGGPDAPLDKRRHWWVNTASVGVVYGKPTDPLWTFNMPDYIAPSWNRNRPAQTFQVHAPATLTAGTDTDHILTVINGTTYWEVWEAQVDPKTMTVTTTGPGWAAGDIASGPGAGTLSNNDGVRAANFSWIAGLITGQDITAGKIDHALVGALPGELLAIGPNSYIAPATAFESTGFGLVKMGSRIGVPSGAARPAGLSSSIGNMVFDALQKYGAFVGDYTGGPWPAFYTDQYTVVQSQVDPLIAFWAAPDNSSDMDKIGPLLRVADYQP